MANAHSSVNYVEPNISSASSYKETGSHNVHSWKVNDIYDRAPRLEDYSIYFNLEVEVCSRENISANRTITSDVLILSYRTKPNDTASTVNFMGGTKVKCHDANDTSMQYLTTNYADMYVGDLYDYGTTEMIGVKSVDIEYQSSCVPVVTVKFTDVRGISLFQPTELSRTNSYQGINGINADNVAQSFFQCFFRVPMPRFTMTVKGFYGNPVTYECMCDKFDTKFNSNTGDFDITTRFIGYSYSFLTDISIDALLAAPYSDYGGKNGNYNKYWDSQRESGEFTIPNKEGTDMVKMPTLFEIWQEMKNLLSKDIETDTALTDEEKNHEEEISELQEIKSLYQRWYTTLFNVCTERYGKDYCYLFKQQGKDGDYYRILILTKESTRDSLDVDYAQYPDEMKKINKDLYAAIEKYNANDGNFKKLDNVSVDFGDYFPSYLFNNTYLGPKGQVVFNGFHRQNKLSETQVVNNVFYGVDYYDENTTPQEVKDKENKHKRHILETIYDEGTDQYIKCYAIDQDYSSITSRIKALQADANKSDEVKTKEKRLKAINKKMFSEMSWYPSVENFTRIMMAHLETMMHLMYNVATNCEGRTASELGVTTGPNGECIDVNAAKDVIPPFPRVTKNVLGDDGITKVEDTWVGEYNRGTKPFEEVDFIDGFFNAIEKMQALKKDTDMMVAEAAKAENPSSESYGGVVRHPLSSMDFYITKSPYGNSSDISNDLDLYHFSGKVCIRMFNILELSSFRNEQKNMMNAEFVKKVARVEADNFHDNVKIVNDKFLGMLRDGIITPKAVIEKVTSINTSEKCPWGNVKLFSDDSSNMWLEGYKSDSNGNINYIYPIQDVSFQKLKETLTVFNQGNITSNMGNISLHTLPKDVKENSLSTDNGYGSVLITDNINLATGILNNANTNCDDSYTEFYDVISSAATFDDASYSSCLEVDGKPSVCGYIKSLEDKKNITYEVDGDNLKAMNETYESSSLSNLGNDAKNGNTNAYTITEVFGITEDGNQDLESSFKKTNDRIQGSVKFGTMQLDEKNLKNALALLSIRTNDNTLYRNNFTRRNRTFKYLPNLVILKIGAVCFGSGSVNKEYSASNEDDFNNALMANLHVGRNFLPNGLKHTVLNLSKQARYQYAKYFYDWCVTNDIGKVMSKNLADDKFYLKPKRDTNRALLDQNNDFVKKLTNELLKPILIINLSINSTKNSIEGRKKVLPLPQGIAEAYLDSFIERLKEHYKINYTEDANGNLIKTTDEPHQTTDDMKAELYRYMKQLYDKWIPMSSFDDWKMKSFFPTKDNGSYGGEGSGHKFYFIDSYYNELGQKLLINPRNLMDRIDALLGSGDVNAMMLGFMADVYAFNRCMLKCIQNFFDLTQEGSMSEMFTPMTFNSIDWQRELNKHSSFVVIYPYEPSKNLNIPNNEYNDDGFMLNDENETPKAIRSKSGGEGMMRIPAFGVAYGKQYQSYFKSVNINMQNAVATQQSIKAKHYILQQNANVKQRGVAAQDLYDVYSNQSYTCDVEMMGCAWVQPLMYFVLLNVPMFRGSYLIMKVRHSIKPGDMTTTFTGCRMANMSTKLVEDIFTDDDFLANGEYNEEAISDREMKADLCNDCAYKVYPLWGSDDVQLSKDEMENAYNAMKILMDTYGFTKEAAAGMCGNIFKESTWRLHAKNGIGAFGLCQWLGDRKALLIKKYGEMPTFAQQMEYIDYEWKNESVAKSHRTELMSQRTPEDAAYVVRKYFERPGKNEADDTTRKSRARKYYDAYGTKSYTTASTTNKNQNDKKDVSTAFFEAINKTAQVTPTIGVQLKNLGVSNGYLKINQNNGKTDKLRYVFDLILNSEYYNYVQELGYIYPNGGLLTNCPPDIIYCKVTEKPNQAKKNVWITEWNQKEGTKIPNELPDGNETLLKALAKRAKTVGNEANFVKEISQAEDKKNRGHVVSFLEKYKPQDCGSLFNRGNSDDTPSQKPSKAVPNNANIEIDGWSVKKAVKWIVDNQLPQFGNGKCAEYVERAIAAGGGPLSRKMSCTENGAPNTKATNLRYYGILEKHGFVQIHSSTVNPGGNTSFSLQAGDVCIIGHKSHGKYHACMWTGDRWYSDHMQNNMISSKYPKSDAPYPYAIYRFHNKEGKQV